MKQSEIEIGKSVIEWLMDMRWDVYQEVQLFSYGKIADIVAVQGKLIWVIELKTSLTFQVIAQACWWKQYSHYVSVAVPSVPKNEGRQFAEHVLEWQGIGLLLICDRPYESRVKTKLNRHVRSQYLMTKLKPEHKEWAEAGNSNSNRYSPFQETSRDVLRKVNECPGITLKELINAVHTHYRSMATAKACIAKWVQLGVIKGVRVEKEGKLLRLYPVVALWRKR